MLFILEIPSFPSEIVAAFSFRVQSVVARSQCTRQGDHLLCGWLNSHLLWMAALSRSLSLSYQRLSWGIQLFPIITTINSLILPIFPLIQNRDIINSSLLFRIQFTTTHPSILNSMLSCNLQYYYLVVPLHIITRTSGTTVHVINCIQFSGRLAQVFQFLVRVISKGYWN